MIYENDDFEPRRYERDQDFDEITDLNKNREDDDFIGNEVVKMVQDELSEPELMRFCNDYPEGIKLVKKCMKMVNEKSWEVLQKYLNETIVCKDDDVMLNGEQRVLYFVKHFYLVFS